MANTSSAIISIYIYTGTSGSYQATDLRYTLSKKALPNEENIVLEISELVKDYFDQHYNGESFFSTLQWVTVLANVYDESDNLLAGSPISKTFLAFDGYGKHTELINPELSKGLLQSNTKMYVPSGENVYVPVFAEDTPTISFYGGSGAFISNVTVSDSGNSAQKIQYINAPVGTEKIVYNGTNTGVTNLDVEIIDECLYTPKKVVFLNKFGCWQQIFFLKKSTSNITYQEQKYKRNTVSINTKSYEITKPTDVRFNVIANESLILNTGFVDEEFNDVIEDLLMSEKVYVLHNDFTVPVIPKTKSFEVKTRINNKLINHLIEFEMANTVQNLIR